MSWPLSVKNGAKIPAKITFAQWKCRTFKSIIYPAEKKNYWNEQHFGMRQKLCRLPFYWSDVEHIYFTTSFLSPSVAVHSKWKRGCKFRSPKMNLNAFLCRFLTVFGKYIRILDQVSKIRRFHSIPFEFQGFENRPQICFLPFRILYCKLILRALSLLFCGLKNV